MRLKLIILGVFMLAFFSALILKLIGKNTYPLNGEQSLPGKPEFSYESFLEAHYQDDYAEYLRTHVQIYSELIRINNQFRFTFFNTLPGGDIFEGNKGYLFDKGRIRTYNGDDYMGQFGWDYYMNVFGFVSDTLHKLNKPMLYVNAGDKPRIMYDVIPEKYLKPQTDSTNYSLYLRKLKNDSRIEFIDMAGYFLKIKDTCKVELYPKYSMHWSLYSVYLTTDSIVKYINKNMLIYEAANPVLKGFEVSKKERMIEYDMLKLLNMYFAYSPIENHYPVVKFTKKTAKKKPRVMVIGDSFGQMLADNNYIFEAFDDSSIFVRYNSEFKRKGSTTLINVNNIDYWAEFNKADAVIFISSELNLGNFGLTFFEKAYDHFKGINNWIDYYNNRNVTRTIEGYSVAFTIKKGVDRGMFLSSRNPNVKAGKTYKLTYKVKGKGEMCFDFYPDNLPQTLQVFDSDNWKNYEWEFTMPEKDMPNVVLFRGFLDSKFTVENELQLKDFKLQEVK